MQTWMAIDISSDPIHRDLWSTGNPQALSEKKESSLPPNGFASPMGFWLSPQTAGLPKDAYSLTYHGTGTVGTMEKGDAPRTGARCLNKNVTIKGSVLKEGELTLIVGPKNAAVYGPKAAWDAALEAVMLAVCQYWRFVLIEQTLDQIGAYARKDVRHMTMSGIASWMAAGHLISMDQKLRRLALDLPHFEGLLIDPFRFCSSERSVELYNHIAEKLEIEPWCDYIDAKIETIEGHYDTATDKLFHYRLFFWGIVIEVIITFILILNLIHPTH